MITHHAGDDPAKMIYGDPGVESIYEWGAKMAIPTRGATGQGRVVLSALYKQEQVSPVAAVSMAR